MGGLGRRVEVTRNPADRLPTVAAKNAERASKPAGKTAAKRLALVGLI
jgi:hypothetical protein